MKFGPLSLLQLSLALLWVLASQPAHATQYKIDPEHSSVSFKIRHLVAKTQGQFKRFEGTIQFDPKKPKKSDVSAVIDVKSIDTGVQKRDQHLLSKDFFDVKKHPQITFEGTKIVKVKNKGKKGELVGKLTMNGVTKNVVLDVELGGIAEDPWGNQRIGFTGTTVLNRKEFNVDWNQEGKDGSLILGEEVEITLEIEGIKKS